MDVCPRGFEPHSWLLGPGPLRCHSQGRECRHRRGRGPGVTRRRAVSLRCCGSRQISPQRGRRRESTARANCTVLLEHMRIWNGTEDFFEPFLLSGNTHNVCWQTDFCSKIK
ncbi:uncharacterized protein O9250_000786 isoform 1-T2 [Rhynochetos jubatus]